MDVTLPFIAAAMSAAAALAGYRAGKNRHLDYTRELDKIGALLGLRRRRRETNDEYAVRLVAFMQLENS
jgi:hypothetical protein